VVVPHAATVTSTEQITTIARTRIGTCSQPG
jgi:hypothetical protein